MSILQIVDLKKDYGEEPNITHALNGIQFEVDKGEFVGIMGASGSGKTTLLNCISTIDTATNGHIYLDGKDILEIKEKDIARFRRESLGFIFQDFNLIPSLNVWENIVLPLGLDNRKVKPREVEDILKKIGLQDKKDAMPSALSGGQKQRTAIARALVTRPAIILADEPTGNLDSQTELEVMSLLKSCVSDFGQTLIMITHDETIAQMADEMIIIEDGKAVRR